MNSRGQYGSVAQGRVRVGAFLVHTLELKQRYNNVKTAAVQALLNDLSSVGSALSIGTNRWEIALKEGTWVQLTWYPDSSALEITITDRELRPVDQLVATRRRYETLLRRLTPRLQSFGATTVGAAIVGQTPAPRLAARARAIRAVQDRPATAGCFDANGRGLYGSRREMVGLTLYHSVGDRADAVKQMDIDWNALFANLASQIPGELTDPSKRIITPAVQKALDEEKSAWQITESFKSLVDEVYRIEKLLNAAGVDKKITERWREESVPPYADISMYSTGNAEPLKQQFLAAKQALDKFMPKAQRRDAIKRAQEASYHRGEVELQAVDPKKLEWWKSYAGPLIREWVKFKHEQIGGDRTVADDYISFAERFQTNWDVYENWKKKLDNLRAEAQKRGFTVDAPVSTPLPTTVWADVAHTVEKGAEKVVGGVEDVWKFVKYAAYGVLGIGAVVALSSVAQNLRSGKDPSEKYMELIRERRRPRAPRALPGRAQRALPPGEPAMEGV